MAALPALANVLLPVDPANYWETYRQQAAVNIGTVFPDVVQSALNPNHAAAAYNGPLPIQAVPGSIGPAARGHFVGFYRGVIPNPDPRRWWVVYGRIINRQGPKGNQARMQLWVHGMNFLGEVILLPARRKASRRMRLIAFNNVFLKDPFDTKMSIYHEVAAAFRGFHLQDHFDHAAERNWLRAQYGLPPMPP